MNLVKIPTQIGNGIVVFNVFIPLDTKFEPVKARAMADESSKRLLDDVLKSGGPTISGTWGIAEPTKQKPYSTLIFAGVVRGAVELTQVDAARHTIDDMLSYLVRNTIVVHTEHGKATSISVQYGDQTYSLIPQKDMAHA